MRQLYKILEYSKLLITHHPHTWEGYGIAAKSQIELKRFIEAKALIKLALNSKQLNLLITVSNAYSVSGDHENSQKFAELLIKHHPDERCGYEIAIGAISLQNLNKLS